MTMEITGAHETLAEDAEERGSKVPAEELNLQELWEHFPTYNRGNFIEFLRAQTTEPEMIVDVVFCTDCNDPKWRDETDPAHGDSSTRVCDTCSENRWSCCEHCDDLERTDSMTTVADGDTVCGYCRANNYTYCDECEGYYRAGNPDHEENHEDEDGAEDGCCASPAPAFTVRNDGMPPLAENTRATVTLPKGTIPSEGLSAIRRYLLDQSREAYNNRNFELKEKLYNLAYTLHNLSDQWQQKDGNYTKRLSRYAYQSLGLKVAPEILSQVGCIARDHSGRQVSLDVEVTRDLNQSALAFGNDGSCWWGSYAASRCVLKTNGGYGLRTFSADDEVTGRAWVMPLKKAGRTLAPTFETVAPDALVVFNGYGDLDGYTAARVTAHMAGMTYRKIRFQCDYMYVNNCSGYLVAPEEIADQYTDSSLHLYTEKHSSLYQVEQAVQAGTAETAERVTAGA